MAPVSLIVFVSPSHAVKMHTKSCVAMKNKILSLAQRRQTLSFIAVVLVLALALSLPWLLLRSGSSRAAPAPVPAMIRSGERIEVPAGSPLRQRLAVAPTVLSEGAHALALPGQIEADPAHTINVLPPVAGKVIALKVGLGDRVRQGQPLLVMTSGDFAQAASDRQKASDALQLAQKVVERQRGVQQAGAGAAKDLEQAESNYVQARAEFARADTRLKSLGNAALDSGGRSLTVLAPTAGSITALATGVGQNANDLTASMMTIANLDSVWVTANVPENMLSAVAAGQAVNISLPAYPAQKYQGKVAFISDILQPDTRRSPVRITMRNPDGRLKPNMYANVTFAVTQPKQVVVPASALLMNNDNTTVFVEVVPWTFVRRTVETGYEEQGLVRIQHGLEGGERIVIKGGVLLND